MPTQALPDQRDQPRAAAWRLKERFGHWPWHARLAKNNYDHWIWMAASNLARLRRLKEQGTPEAMSEYQQIIAVIGKDVFAEFEWGISQPPVHY